MIELDYVNLGIGAGAGILFSLIVLGILKLVRRKVTLEKIISLIESIDEDLVNSQKQNIEAHNKLNKLYGLLKGLRK